MSSKGKITKESFKNWRQGGPFFDREDIADFLDLSLPGMDEVMAVIEMAGLLREQ